MSESPERIASTATRYEIRAIERDLLAAYYEYLLEDTRRFDDASLIQHANAARLIASMWADLPDDDQQKVPDAAGKPIQIAARIMYYVADLIVEPVLRAHWYREASIAYLQGGNVPGCATSWSRYKALSDGQPSDFLIDATLGHTADYPKPIREMAPKCLRRPWLAFDISSRDSSRRELYDLSLRDDAGHYFDKALAYRVGASLPLLGALSITGLLQRNGITIPDWYRQALFSDQRLLLMPSQVAALETWLGSNGNVVLCTPTSTGKTFVAEVAIILALCADGGIGVFITPYRAVARAICDTLTDRIKDGDIDVVRAYGDEVVSINSERVIVVGTPEKVDAVLLANPGLMSDARVVVFDEVHVITQRLRGAFYETLIARVLLEQEVTGHPARILAISAVVDNQEDLARWFRTSDVARSEWRPNPIVESYWTRNDELLVYDQFSERSSPEFQRFFSFAPQFPAWPRKGTPDIAMTRALSKPVGERCSWYVRHWSDRTGGPVLVICASRAQTREFAYLSAGRLPTVDDQHNKDVADEIDTTFPYLSLLTFCIRRGVAYHNAALPTQVRHLIEDLVKTQSLTGVYATTTLAEGADFPFRAVMIASPAHFDAESETHAAMSPLLLRNIAGRGGRTVGQLIGDVVQLYSPYRMEVDDGGVISSEDVFTNRLLDPTECRVTSTIAERTVSTSESRTRSILYHAFDKMIDRLPDRDNSLAAYRNCFFDHSMRGSEGREFELQYEQAMRSGGAFREPLALRASPLRLTELGRVVMNTGFAITSAGVIWQELETRNWFDDVPGASDIVTACSRLGGKIDEVSELRGNRLRPLNDDNIGNAFDAFTNGASMSEVYMLVEKTSGAGIRKRAEALIEGDASADDSVHARFEAFSDELKRKLLLELPPVVRAMRLFVEYRNPDLDSSVYGHVLDVIAKLRQVID